MGAQLLEAERKGLLENASAIVIGKSQNKTINPAKLKESSPLKQFVRESPIPILFTNPKDTFGHSEGNITKPFAHFAPTTLTHAEDGVILRIEGHARQETLEKYYNHNRVPVLPEVKEQTFEQTTLHGNVTLCSGDTKDLTKANAILIDIKTLGELRGITAAINANEKVIALTMDQVNMAPLEYIMLIAASISGDLEGAEAVILVTPPETLSADVCNALRDMTNFFSSWEADSSNSVFETKRPMPNDVSASIKKTLEQSSFSAEITNVSPTLSKVSVSLNAEEQKKVLEAEKTYSNLSINHSIMKHIGAQYLGNIPVYIMESSEYAKTKGIYQCRINLNGNQITPSDKYKNISIDALDLATSDNNQESKNLQQKSWAERVVSKSPKGSREV